MCGGWWDGERHILFCSQWYRSNIRIPISGRMLLTGVFHKCPFSGWESSLLFPVWREVLFLFSFNHKWMLNFIFFSCISWGSHEFFSFIIFVYFSVDLLIFCLGFQCPCSWGILVYNSFLLCVWFWYQGNAGFFLLSSERAYVVDIISSLNVWQNSQVKPFEPGVFFMGRSLITNSFSSVNKGSK